MKSDTGNLYIAQDRPFSSGTLSWIEFDKDNNQLNFIMDDGDIRDFGISVNPDFASILSDYKNIPIALVKNSLFVDGAEFPLIIHGGY